MRSIIIYDFDYYKDRSKVNYLAMRIASFHKQKGDCVTLASNEADLRGAYDEMYILKDSDDKDIPDMQLMLRKNVHVYGIPYFNNWKADPIVLGCRPDYLLYPPKITRGYTNIFQFTDNNGHILKKQQNAFNALGVYNRTLVTDDNL